MLRACGLAELGMAYTELSPAGADNDTNSILDASRRIVENAKVLETGLRKEKAE